MAEPTSYPELNDVLRELVTSARSILSENFCAAYLQGSFAIAEADAHSDVDFVVVTHDEVGQQQLSGLQLMHKRIHALDVPWAQHLEGSYIPQDRLRRVDPARSPFLFLDNGASELVWDDHCNTAVVRWLLREHGIALAGPDPRQLIDPVSSDELRSEALAAMPEYAAWARASNEAGAMSCWQQPYLVLAFCRMLHTAHRGTVASKREAGEWALGALDPEWAGFIRGALADRPDPWRRVHEAAEPEDVDRTLAFIDYAMNTAGVCS